MRTNICLNQSYFGMKKVQQLNFILFPDWTFLFTSLLSNKIQNVMIRKCLALMLLMWAGFATSQENDSTLQLESNTPENKSKLGFFVGYDFGEAMVNKFRSASGEVGISLPNRHLIRLVHMNVWLTESHLKSDFVTTVKGGRVDGRMIGLEAFYNFPLFKWKNNTNAVYLSPSIGYYSNYYRHLDLNSSFKQNSMTVGAELSLRENDPFGIKGLYYAVTFPFRIHFRPHDEMTLGNTVISSNKFDGNIWFFIGYEF